MKRFFHGGVVAFLLFWGVFVVVCSIVYVTIGMTFISSLIALAVSVGATAGSMLVCPHIQPEREQDSGDGEGESGNFFWKELVCISPVALDLFLLWTVWHVRTDEALRTIWSPPVTIWLFVLYGCATFLLLISARTQKRMFYRNTLALHAFVAWGLMLIAFRYGYGYDPIIHQAAERYIFEHGSISPLQPFYTGQYSVVAALSFLTGVSTDLVDRLLLPLLASATIPFMAYQSFLQSTRSPGRAWRACIALALFPIAALTFTVPHNMTVLYAIWWFFLLTRMTGSRLTMWTSMVIMCAALLTHPLLSVPLIVAYCSAGAFARCGLFSMRLRQILFGIAGSVSVGAALPGMFGILRATQGLPLLDFTGLGNGARMFLSLFSPPRFAPDLSIELATLYGYEFFIKNMIPFFGCLLLARTASIVPRTRVALISIAFGIPLGIFFLLTSIHIPGIAPEEQYEFVLRLKDAWAITLFLIVLWHAAMAYRSHSAFWKWRYVATGVFAAASAASLYLTYPQVNTHTVSAGMNVSRFDIQAVEYLEHVHNGHEDEYVVLAPPLLSAVGLREVGFDKTFLAPSGTRAHSFPIGPREPLYTYAQELLYRGLSSENAKQLRALVGTRILYAAVPTWWPRSAEIRSELRKQGAMTVYRNGGIALYRL